MTLFQFRFISRTVILLVLSGCQDQMMSDDRLTSAISGVLGVPPSDLSLSDRRSDGATNTYVTAHVKGGQSYACTVNGGGLLAAGMINPPSCRPALR